MKYSRVFSSLFFLCIAFSFITFVESSNAYAGPIWTDCGRFGHSIPPQKRCPSGKQLYGGLCYKSCYGGWRRTAVCTCVKRSCRSVRYPCPVWNNLKRMCTKSVCADKPWTDCGRFGGATSPRTSCPSGRQMYGGRCYRSCPGGYVRTAVCSCEQRGWKKRYIKRAKRITKKVVKLTGKELAKKIKEFKRFSNRGARTLKRTIERKSRELARRFVHNIQGQMRRHFKRALRRLDRRTQQAVTNELNYLLRLAKRDKARFMRRMRSNANKFRARFSNARMLRRARGAVTRRSFPKVAKSIMKNSTAQSLMIDAVLASAMVPAWAAIECSHHRHGSAAYKRCFESKALLGTKHAVFDFLFGAAYTPIEMKIVTPASIKLAAAVTAAVALATGGIGAVGAGIIVGVSARIAISIVVMEEADKLFPYYDRYIWQADRRAQEAYRRIYRNFANQISRSTNWSKGAKAGGNRRKPRPSRTHYTICLRAHNGRNYVVSEGDKRSVNANRRGCGPWEKHTIYDVNGGSLNSGDTIYIRTHHGRYWSAQPNGNLEANRTARGGWEKFRIYKARGSGRIYNGNRIGLYSYHRRWVVAEGGGGRNVRVNRTGRGAWETFTLFFR